MTIVIKKNSSRTEKQAKLLELHKERMAKQYKAKKQIVEETFGKVQFDPNKTALEIYKEMRNEWSS